MESPHNIVLPYCYMAASYPTIEENCHILDCFLDLILPLKNVYNTSVKVEILIGWQLRVVKRSRAHKVCEEEIYFFHIVKVESGLRIQMIFSLITRN